MKSNGTSTSTVLVKDFRPGPASTTINQFVSLNNKVYLQAADDIHGLELWETDGSEPGTRMVADIKPGPGSSNPSKFVVVNERLFLEAYTPENGAELWRFVPNAPPTDLTISQTSINENRPTGSAIGTLSTNDPNAGDQFTYGLVSGSGDTDNSSFTIVGNQLRTAVLLNFESKSSYQLRVRSTDQGGLTVEKALTITVVDLPELSAPAVIGDGTNQRSLVKQLVLTFDGNVTIAAGAFIVDKLGTGGSAVTTAYVAVPIVRDRQW